MTVLDPPCCGLAGERYHARLTAADLDVLDSIWHGNTTARELEIHTGRGKGAVGRVLRALVAAGLVTRRSTPAGVRLTAHGRRAHESARRNG